MSTFLELCQDTARDSGTVTGGNNQPSTVVNQTGRLLKVVQWVKAAWLAIQNEDSTWRFHRIDWQGSLIINTKFYAAGDILSPTNAAMFGEWIKKSEDGRNDIMTIWDPAIGQENESSLAYIDYGAWKRMYDRGSQEANRPVCWSISPDNKICVSKPDKAYVMRGVFRRTAQILTNNDDTPICATRFHATIQHRALMLLHEHDEAVPNIAFAKMNYNLAISVLRRDETPTVTIGGPFA